MKVSKIYRGLRLLTLFNLVLALLVFTVAEKAYAFGITNATFSGGSGTATVNSTFYAKGGTTLSLTVTTSNDVKCVVLSGAFTASLSDNNGNTSWAFNSLTVPSGATDGSKTVTVTAHKNQNCTTSPGNPVTTIATYVVDNTKPTASASATLNTVNGSPYTANTWTSQNVVVHFTGQDGTGSGIASCSADAPVNSEGVTSQSGTCTDKVGNVSDSVSFGSIKIDKTVPNIMVTAKKADNSAYTAGAWTNQNVTVSYSCSDPNISNGPPVVAGSGVNTGVSSLGDDPFSATGVANATCVDNAGNSFTTFDFSVQIDKVPPTIAGNREPAANSNGWNNTDVTVSFECKDGDPGPGTSGIASCTPSTPFKNDGANQSVQGTAVDQAGNIASITVGNINIDKVKPTLSGVSTTQPNTNGWYNGEVTIHWTCTDDGGSGFVTGACPADSKLTGDGKNQTLSASVTDKAGNMTSANSSPAVNIDTVAPNTTASAPTAWNNVDVTVDLNASDGLSDVAATYYILDGGAQQAGTSVGINSEGIHTLKFWSVDKAGNTEIYKTAQIKIDKTPPTINHTLNPNPNLAGWNNSNVTVTFICGDGAGSGIASCTPEQTVTTEGPSQSVPGKAIDNAGNSADDPATVSVDKTAPTITGAPDRPANTNNWYKADVTVSFSCDDLPVGIASGVKSCPAPTTLGEGAGQSVKGEAVDTADNHNTFTVSGINIDKTPPSLSGAAKTLPNSNGWYKGDVTIAWPCSDALSLIDGTCPPDSIIGGEGDNLSDNASVSDKAGNTTNASVTGIKIDRTAPNTMASVPTPTGNGWYADSVEVTLSTLPDLSGVAATYYTIDGGPATPYSGPFTVNGGGPRTINFWSVDKADNVEDATASTNSILVKIDDTKPTITGSRSPEANEYGWNNGPVDVTFTCDDSQSDIDTCVGNTTLSNEGAGKSVTGTATDNVGKTASTTVSNINIDLTAPTLSGAPTTAANDNGWYKGDVTIKWTGTDALSGINPATQPADSTITGEGNDLGVYLVSIADKAGNSTSVSVNGIKIDRTAPVITVSAKNADDSAYTENTWTGQDVTVAYTCSDGSGSGVDAAASDLADDVLSATGTASATCVDNAGNSASVTFSVKIDKTPPVIEPTLVGDSGLNGWYVSDVDVTWSVTDPESGVSSKIGCDPVTISADTTGTEIKCTAASMGGETSFTQSIKRDTIPPTISGVKSPTPNTYGWNNSNVTVDFTCDDATSGVASCGPTPQYFAVGATQEGTGTAVDNAGNKATQTVGDINIDKTNPAISGAKSPAANTAGWNNSDVTVNFTCDDDSAGVATCAAPQTVTVEGEDQKVTGSVTDKADNSASTNVFVSLDKTKPVADTTIDPIANVAGWWNSPVTVKFIATDKTPGSGVDKCDAPVTFSSEGTGFSATGSCTDVAGNTSAAVTASNIRIDMTAPDTQITTKPASSTNVDTAAFTFSGTDAGGSGIVKYECSLDNDPFVDCSSGSVSYKDLSTGTRTFKVRAVDAADNVDATPVTYSWSVTLLQPIVDAATTGPLGNNGWYVGNVAVSWNVSGNGAAISSQTGCGPTTISSDTAGTTLTCSVTTKGGTTTVSVTIKRDTTKPTISGAVVGTPNGAGWFNSSVTVHFTCDDALSKIDTCSDDLTVNSDGANQSVTGTATDMAGNSASAMVSGIKLDKTNPTATATANPAPNAAGWNNSTITVAFSGVDATSGIASCSASQLLSGEGNNQQASGICTDNAGNQSLPAVATVKIDMTKPVVNVTGVANNGNYTLSNLPTIGCNTQDALSGVAKQATPTVTGGNANGVGTLTATCADAADKAGNTSAPVSVTYKVTYSFAGFFAPVQNAPVVNTSQAGQSIPVKFSLGGNYGLNVFAAGYPVSQQVDCTTGVALSSPVPTVTAGGSALTVALDNNSYQYNYVWQTDKAWNGTCRKLTVSFNDGTPTRTALFQFKSNGSVKSASTVAIPAKNIFLPLINR